MKNNFNETALITLAQQIKPLVANKEGDFCFIEPVDIKDESFTWSPKFLNKASEIKEIGETATHHTAGYAMFFKPSIAEVLEQIPESIRAQNPVAFKTELSNNFDHSSYKHIAKTTFYTGELPTSIKSQPVIHKGQIYNQLKPLYSGQ